MWPKSFAEKSSDFDYERVYYGTDRFIIKFIIYISVNEELQYTVQLFFNLQTTHPPIPTPLKEQTKLFSQKEPQNPQSISKLCWIPKAKILTKSPYYQQTQILIFLLLLCKETKGQTDLLRMVTFHRMSNVSGTPLRRLGGGGPQWMEMLPWEHSAHSHKFFSSSTSRIWIRNSRLRFSSSGRQGPSKLRLSSCCAMVGLFFAVWHSSEEVVS